MDTNNTILAKNLKAGDVVLAWSDLLQSVIAQKVKRVHRATRKDWNHVTIYFRSGQVTTVLVDTPYRVAFD